MSQPIRRRVIAGNWKMFKTIAETRSFFAAFLPLVAENRNSDIVIAPPFTAISAAVEAAADSKVAIAGQDVYWEMGGAFARAGSPIMLVEAGCRFIIIGHSKRRPFIGDTDERVTKTTKAAMAPGLMPIVCVGEK